jgi:hypothetical protein
MNDFDRELEHELWRILDPISAAPIPPRRAIESRAKVRMLLGGTGAALGIKVLTGVVAAAAAITVAGAATTGSLNPQSWGQRVDHQVQVCKATVQDSGHAAGIGQCVSQLAQQHGSTAGSSNANGSGQSAKAKGRSEGNPNANSNSKGGNQGKNTGGAAGHADTGGSGQGSNSEPTDPSGGGHPPVHISPGP